MKHITYGQKSLIVGDDAASALLAYAAAVARHRTGDHVTLMGFAADGNEIEATLVLDSGTLIISESVRTSASEPDNSAAVADLRARTSRLDNPPAATDGDAVGGEQTLVDPY